MVNDQSEDFFAGRKEGYDDGYIEGFNDALMQTANKINFAHFLLIKDSPAAIQIKEIEESVLKMWKR
ncbi:hypothetical protein PBI_GRAYSON_30 [Rhodococcus phage Grayson]|nr:hypothetical protein PBI_GRAYSON_30 [Rhodococcus phage Grayson]